MVELLKEISNVSLAYIILIVVMLLFYLIVAGIAYTNINELVTAANGPCGADLDAKCGDVVGDRLSTALMTARVTLGVAGITLAMVLLGTFIQMRRK